MIKDCGFNVVEERVAIVEGTGDVWASVAVKVVFTLPVRWL